MRLVFTGQCDERVLIEIRLNRWRLTNDAYN